MDARRIENINYAEKANRKYFRRTRVRDYLAGQAIYNLGDYPVKIDATPTEYDQELIKRMAKSGTVDFRKNSPRTFEQK